MPITQDEEEEEPNLSPLPKERLANQPAITSFFMKTPTIPKKILQKMTVAGQEEKLQEQENTNKAHSVAREDNDKEHAHLWSRGKW